MKTLLLMAALLVQDKDWGPREWGGATKSLKEGKDWSHHYVAKEATCPVCAEKIRVAEVGTYTTAGKDLDFKVARYVSANPYLFRLWMCPKCNYCAWARDFEAKVDVEKIKKALGEAKAYDSYFDIPYSVLLARAEQCYSAREFSDDKWAWFYLYGAWVARDSDRKEAEKSYLKKAQAKFEVVAEKGEGNDKAAAAYLVAEIHRRAGDREKAQAWLDKAAKIAEEVKSENIPGWIKACREEMDKKEK